MIKIVTDSTSNLPKSITDEYDITVVPTYLHFGDKLYYDGVTITSSEFYRKLVEAPDQASTSQIPVKDFRKAFQRLCETNPEVKILSIHLSQHLSGTIESARGAADAMPNVPIRIYDTMALALGTGLMVLEAAKMARAGQSLDDILKRLDAMRDSVKLYWTVETLDYLARSGRIGKGARFLGTMLDVKPILSIKKGAIDPHSKPRSRQKAVAEIRELAMSDCKGKQGIHLGVMHTVAEQEAQMIADELKASLNPDVMIINELTPAVGVYCGPGMIGLAWCFAPPGE